MKSVCPGHEDSSPLSVVAARKVHTKLPSFTEQYTQSTPLTRIRDLAHRNDIPHELKQEIKHTIQVPPFELACIKDGVKTTAFMPSMLLRFCR